MASAVLWHPISLHFAEQYIADQWTDSGSSALHSLLRQKRFFMIPSYEISKSRSSG